MSECFKVFSKCFMSNYMCIRWLINWSDSTKMHGATIRSIVLLSHRPSHCWNLPRNNCSLYQELTNVNYFSLSPFMYVCIMLWRTISQNSTAEISTHYIPQCKISQNYLSTKFIMHKPKIKMFSVKTCGC